MERKGQAMIWFTNWRFWAVVIVLVAVVEYFYRLGWRMT